MIEYAPMPAPSRYLVTGASSGLGLALAREIVRRGGSVWGVARREALLAEAAKEAPDRFRWTACDTGDREAVRSAAAEMERAGFFPEAAVLNAGVNVPDAEEAFDAGRFEEMLRVNLLGTVYWVEALLPAFQRRGGRFVAISSMAAIQGNPRSIGYAVSKHALSETVRYLRLRYGGGDVSFSAVHLGAIDTPMSRSTTMMPGAMSAERAARIVLAAAEGRRRSVYRPLWMRAVSLGARSAPEALLARMTARVGSRKPSRDPMGSPEPR